MTKQSEQRVHESKRSKYTEHIWETHVNNREKQETTAESERLVDSKVAEGFEDRIVEKVAFALRTTSKPAVVILYSSAQGTCLIAKQTFRRNDNCRGMESVFTMTGVQQDSDR